jgi:hypothetical protein
MWVEWFVFMMGRTVMFSAREEILDRRYIEDSRDPKNSIFSQLVCI